MSPIPLPDVVAATAIPGIRRGDHVTFYWSPDYAEVKALIEQAFEDGELEWDRLDDIGHTVRLKESSV
jgi:hypothetical protein